MSGCMLEVIDVQVQPEILACGVEGSRARSWGLQGVRFGNFLLCLSKEPQSTFCRTLVQSARGGRVVNNLC